ncbi:microcystin-dependent protein [Caulobacter ginsengisoli]|uniref:Microcystin-dependent protein n=1 Tax=Caulobacter ginsengisoli TaxID=400775 RepID=A0ABU0INF9_9CAUL|nr:tail fiber protein [Caulobacter ginsengisoli]MDQ0463542.1 microcystin-dependent protein [Caulobacter ginsengisoli]
MAQPFIGEVRMFGGNFAPSGWMLCQGQLIPISENDTLFNLIGTTYGGDGQETFALPDLQGRVPMHAGTAPAFGTTYQLGEKGGTESVTLTTQQMPVHNHPPLATTQGPVNSPQGALLGIPNGGPAGTTIYGSDVPLQALNATSVQGAGGSQPHENMQPFLVINFIISLFGVFPTQN